MFLVSRAVVPHMVQAGRGSVINLTINHKTMVRRGFSPYGPSKAALELATAMSSGQRVVAQQTGWPVRRID